MILKQEPRTRTPKESPVPEQVRYGTGKHTTGQAPRQSKHGTGQASTVRGKKNITVRFAPSPTGYLHIGGLRTYLYNWLFAKKYKGTVILRIEDTDDKRKIPGAAEGICNTLKTMGLPWDKGPYFQSQRIGTYQNFAQKLINKGSAYYCFCSPQRLKQLREEQLNNNLPPAYDGLCRVLPKQAIDKKLNTGTPYVIRLKVPANGPLSFDDKIHGVITVDLKTIDDQILVKSDGWPTYHLANVVDDHMMEITHVIRGEEWLPSVSKHILIYRAFSWDIPTFVHLPLLTNPDKSKLSKRQGDIAVEDYVKQGYLKQALVNFLALCGWNPDTDKEIFTLQELIASFSLEQIQGSSAIYNREKLDWMNGYYIRKMRTVDLTKKCIPYFVQSGFIKPLYYKFKITKTKKNVSFKWLQKIIALEQGRIKRLDEIGTVTDFFFTDEIEYDPHILLWKKMSAENVKDNLMHIKKEIKKIHSWCFRVKKITYTLNKLAESLGVGEIFWPFRTALSGRKASPPPQDIAEILGKKKVIDRIDKAIKMLT